MLNRPDLNEELSKLLRGPRSKTAADELGLDSSEVSRFLSGQRGLNRDQIVKAVEMCGFVLVTPSYLNAVCYLAGTGVSCECARLGHGECGRRREGTAN